ncbi:MAG: GNAT family N-acetyltransferase [Anaerolineae bacterium]|nr:GNAT family N-acetyltransferase [Anaerolineae bacterium]
MDSSAEPCIRPAVRADAQAIHDLHTASVTTLCVTHYPPDLIRQWIARRTPEGYFEGIDQGEMFVCEVERCVAGFGHAKPGEVVGLFVHPDFARQGIGARLLGHALAMARHDHEGPVGLIATLNAESFYQKHGFKAVRRFSVLRNGADIAVVEMRLAPAP